MSAEQIDTYLETVDEPKRSTLEEMRSRILEIIPDAEQTMSYGLPAFKLHGKVIAGLGAFSAHLSYLPHSGSVLAALGKCIAGYSQTQSALHFPIDEPLPRELVRELISIRIREARLL